VPETVTHVKRLDIKKGAMTSFEDFLDKISTLKGIIICILTRIEAVVGESESDKRTD
jgi:hypothetical protein